ncbi:MAG TPA: hypothetical protein VIK39_03835 [Candidatus Angelobacter sp.]
MKKLFVMWGQILILTAGLSAGANGRENGFVWSASSVWLEQKTIKDPAEYNAYISALNTTDPAARAAAMEAFANQYPNSVVKIDALEQAMAAYQQAGNAQKVEQTAGRILELDANNIRALAIATYIARTQASAGNAAKLKNVCADSQKGIQALPGWPRPEGLSDADFATLRNQIATIFYGAAGFCGLQSKDYAAASAHYTKAFQLDPSDIQNTYQLAIADLEVKPIDPMGFWYCGKSIAIAQAAKTESAAQSITAYCKAKYKNYHGSDDGWDQMLAATAAQGAPPASFASSIKKRPTPGETACQAVQENNPADLSFSDWEFILEQRDAAPCNIEAANKVWAAIQEKQKNGQVKMQILVKVISSSRNSINVAVTDENQQANQIDLQVAMEKPMAKLPVSGTMINVIGVLTKYQLQPFFFVMEKAEFTPAAPGQK